MKYRTHSDDGDNENEHDHSTETTLDKLTAKADEVLASARDFWHVNFEELNEPAAKLKAFVSHPVVLVAIIALFAMMTIRISMSKPSFGRSIGPTRLITDLRSRSRREQPQRLTAPGLESSSSGSVSPSLGLTFAGGMPTDSRAGGRPHAPTARARVCAAEGGRAH